MRQRNILVKKAILVLLSVFLFAVLLQIYESNKSTPHGVVTTLFRAMHNKDEALLQQLSTPMGLQSLQELSGRSVSRRRAPKRDLSKHDHETDQSWIEFWQRWAQRPDSKIHFPIQPEANKFLAMTTNGFYFGFVKTAGGWKLNSCGSGANQ